MVYVAGLFTVCTSQFPSHLGSSLPALGDVSHTGSPGLNTEMCYADHNTIFVCVLPLSYVFPQNQLVVLVLRVTGSGMIQHHKLRCQGVVADVVGVQTSSQKVTHQLRHANRTYGKYRSHSA